MNKIIYQNKKDGLIKYVYEHKYFLLFLFFILLFLLYNYATRGILYATVTNDTSTIINFIRSFGIFSAIAFTILVVVEVIVAPIPGLALYVVAGIIFGPFLGGTLASIGNIIGAAICFKIAEKYGRKLFEKSINQKKLDTFNKYVEKYGIITIFMLRLNPLTSSDVFSYLSGLTRMRFSHLVLGTTFGLTPLVYLQSYIGDNFVKNNPSLYLFFILLSVIYFAVFVYAIYLGRKEAKKLEVKNGLS